MQVVKLVEKFGILQIFIGEFFWCNIEEGIKFGVEVKCYLDVGDLVLFDLINEFVDDWLNNLDVVNGFILDGYLCLVEQVKVFYEMFECWGIDIDVVLEFCVFEEVLLE